MLVGWKAGKLPLKLMVYPYRVPNDTGAGLGCMIVMTWDLWSKRHWGVHSRRMSVCHLMTWISICIIVAPWHKNTWCSFVLLTVGSLVHTECFKGPVTYAFLDNLLRYSTYVHMSCWCCPQTMIGNSPLNTSLFTNTGQFFSPEWFFLQVQQNTMVHWDLRVSSRVGEGRRYHL